MSAAYPVILLHYMCMALPQPPRFTQQNNRHAAAPVYLKDGFAILSLRKCVCVFVLGGAYKKQAGLAVGRLRGVA